MVFRPHRRTGVLVGAAAGLFILALAVGLAWRLFHEPVGLATFTAALLLTVLLALAALFAFWTYGCWSLRYVLDRNRLTIHWGGNQQVVPLAEIRLLVPGCAPSAVERAGGVRWPGYFIGRGRVREIGLSEPGPRLVRSGSGPFAVQAHGVGGVPALGGDEAQSPALPQSHFSGDVLFFSTHRSPADLLYVVTEDLAYALSVPDPAVFAQELKLRRRLGPTEALEQTVSRWLVWDLPAWHDRLLMVLVLLAGLTNLLLFAYVAFLVPSLPALVPLHLTPLGVADRTGFRGELLVLPITGLALIVCNTAVAVALHLRERLGSYLVVLASVVFQGMLWAAMLKLLG